MTAVEPISNQESPNWTVMEGNQNSFPVVRLKLPLLAVPSDDPLWNAPLPARTATGRDLAQSRDALLDVIDRIGDIGFSTASPDLWKRLRDQKASELEAIAGTGEELEPVADLARRFRLAASDVPLLLQQLAAAIRWQLTQGLTDGLDALTALLVGRQKGPTPVQLAFDLDMQSGRVYDELTRRRLTDALLAAEDAPGRLHPGTACAFTGVPEQLLTSPFPKVRLPILNRDFPLMSMFEEAGCNTRYGLTGSGVVPVWERAALAMQDALKYIVDDERRGKTWRGVASGRSELRNGRRIEKPDLLIAYVDGKPDLDAPVVALFGADPGWEAQTFEVAAQAACEALDGIVQERPDSHLNLFLIREASLGQAKAVLSDAPSVREVLDAARRWQAGAANVPPIFLRLHADNSRHRDWRSPRTLYPDQVVRLLSRQWLSGGTRPVYARAVELHEVLDLMLRAPGRWERAAQHLLDLALERVAGLLIGVFAASDRETGPQPGGRADDYPSDARWTALA